MAKDLPLYILDSCCVVAFLIDESKDNKADRVQALLEGHGKDWEIVIPTVVYLETLGKSQMGLNGGYGAKPAARRKALKAARAWVDSQSFMFAELDPLVIRNALDIMDAWGLNGVDAAIVATAQVYEVSKVYTFDDAMLRISTDIPGIEVIAPPEPNMLFIRDPKQHAPITS